MNFVEKCKVLLNVKLIRLVMGKAEMFKVHTIGLNSTLTLTRCFNTAVADLPLDKKYFKLQPSCLFKTHFSMVSTFLFSLN